MYIIENFSERLFVSALKIRNSTYHRKTTLPALRIAQSDCMRDFLDNKISGLTVIVTFLDFQSMTSLIARSLGLLTQ